MHGRCWRLTTSLSKSQYVNQLKKWGYQKYITDVPPSHWRTVDFKVTKAKKLKKNVNVYHKGKLVSQVAIAKQANGAHYTNPGQRYVQGPYSLSPSESNCLPVT